MVSCIDIHPLVTGQEALEDESLPTCFLKYDNNKVNIALVFSINHLVLCTTMLDTGAGPILVFAKLFSTKLLDRVLKFTLTNPSVDANNRFLAVCHSVDLLAAVKTLKFWVRCIVINQFWQRIISLKLRSLKTVSEKFCLNPERYSSRRGLD